MTDTYLNAWASVVVWTRTFIEDLVVKYPDMEGLSFIDWETHGNTPELPNSDLMGPLSIQITEYEKEMFHFSIAIGVSCYTNDDSVFRQRIIVSEIFDRLRATRQIPLYDHAENRLTSVIQMTSGTFVAPMTEITVRPFQMVQCSGLLQPEVET